MPNRPWKAEERRAAALFGGTRFKANTGGPLDFETAEYVGQVKHVQRLSLVELEALALEMERIGREKSPPKLGVVVVKRRAGQGRATPRLVILTEAVWRAWQNCFREAVGTPAGDVAPLSGVPPGESPLIRGQNPGGAARHGGGFSDYGETPQCLRPNGAGKSRAYTRG
jgi:hypothetical protein